MFTEDKITEIFCLADDFCKVFNEELRTRQLQDSRPHRNKPGRLSDSEVMTILIIFHSNGFRCLKHFYKEYVCVHLRHLFPDVVSYNRFVELQKSILLHLAVFIKEVLLGECTGISYVDSTPLKVCHNKRIHNHKIFKGIAQRGKCSMGWFFGFKLHIIINDKGELLNFMFTPANTDDRDPLKNASFVEKVTGKLCGDKGYIDKRLFDFLFLDGVQLITKIRSNMRNILMPLYDKIILRKRALVESVNDELKNIAQVEHSRHRSFANFLTNALGALAAYCFQPKKPSINLELGDNPWPSLF